MRPVATTAVWGRARSGSISGSGFDRANTIGFSRIDLMSSTVNTLGPDTPMKTSAPRMASESEPEIPSGFVLSTSHR